MERWHRLPRKFLYFPSVEIFKNHLDVVLGSLLWVALLEQGLEQVACRGPCQP